MEPKYALRHYGYHATLPRVFACYTEQTKSRATTIKGVTACTIFLKTKTGRDRAVKFGWKDETESVMDEVNKPKPKRRGRPKKI